MKRHAPEDFEVEPPLFARARASDPDTSHAAAASVDNMSKTRLAILDVLRTWGPTDDEMIRKLVLTRIGRGTPSGIRTRRSELVALGLVRDSGKRAETVTGRQAVLWEVTGE